MLSPNYQGTLPNVFSYSDTGSSGNSRGAAMSIMDSARKAKEDQDKQQQQSFDYGLKHAKQPPTTTPTVGPTQPAPTGATQPYGQGMGVFRPDAISAPTPEPATPSIFNPSAATTAATPSAGAPAAGSTAIAGPASLIAAAAIAAEGEHQAASGKGFLGKESMHNKLGGLGDMFNQTQEAMNISSYLQDPIKSFKSLLNLMSLGLMPK